MKKAVAFLLAANIACSLCLTIPQDVPVEVVPSARSLPSCDNVFDLACLKLSMVSFLERVSKPGETQLVPGVTFVSERSEDDVNEKYNEIARSFPDDPVQQIDNYVAYRVARFLEDHSIRVNLIDEETAHELKTIDNEVDLTEEGRGKKKKKKKLKLLALAGGLAAIVKKFVVAAVLIYTIVTAKKALFLAVMALIGVAASAIRGGGGGGGGGGLASLFGSKGSEPAPVSSSSSWGGSQDYSSHGGYARSIEFTLPEKLAKAE